MPSTLILRCTHTPLLQFMLTQSVAILGRSPHCDFRVSDLRVSRRHAELVRRDAGIHVTDLDSYNGTFLDQERIQEGMVAPGQIVTFGGIPFAVLVDSLDGAFDLETPRATLKKRENGECKFERQENLSAAQRRVFDLLMTGEAEKGIARQLSLSPNTVHNHVRAIFRIFGVHSRAQLYALLLAKYGDAQPTG